MCNFKLVYKLLFFILIIVLITVALTFSIINPIFEEYYDFLRDQFEYHSEEIIRHPIKTLQSFFNIFLDYIDVNSSLINLKLLNLSMLFIGLRFFVMLPTMPVTSVLYSKMTTNFDKGLFNSFISTLPQCLLYTLISSVVLGIVDLGLIVLLSLLSVQLIKLLGFISLPICLAIAIAVFSLRMTLFCQWLPEICQNNCKKIFSAFKTSIKPTLKQFVKNFICITVVNTLSVIVITTTLIPTAGLVPMLIIPTFMVLYQSLYLALNFSYRKQKYFIDNGVTVYDPTKMF
jgi:hypothetical protein